MTTSMSGEAVMKPSATFAIPAGPPPLMAIVPPGLYSAATRAGSRLHQASVYLRATAACEADD